MFSRFGKNSNVNANNTDQDTPYEYYEESVVTNNDDTGSIYTTNTIDTSTLRNSTNEMNQNDAVNDDDKFYNHNDTNGTPTNNSNDFSDENNPFRSNNNITLSIEEESLYSTPAMDDKVTNRNSFYTNPSNGGAGTEEYDADSTQLQIHAQPEYDEFGLPISPPNRRFSSDDHNTVDELSHAQSYQTQEYDEYGNPVYYTHTEDEDNDDETRTASQHQRQAQPHYQYDENGNVIFNENDTDTYFNDGDSVRYDINGDPIVQQSDPYDDENGDEVRTTEYGDDYTDADNRGVQYYYDHQYDEEGNLLQPEIDDDYDGQRYDNCGNPIFYDPNMEQWYIEALPAQYEYDENIAAPLGTGYDEDEAAYLESEGYILHDDGYYYDMDGNPYVPHHNYDNDDYDGEETSRLRDHDELTNKKKKRRLRLLRRKKQIRDQQRQELDEVEDRQRRKRLLLILLLCCCCLLLVALILGLILGLKDKEDEPIPEDEPEEFDDDFVVLKPYEGITTTPLDPYVELDCYYGDNIQPHVISQCECFQAINIIANDTLALYQEIKEEINQQIYNGRYNPSPSSCDAANQALIWLSSGNTRDAGDLYQRYVSALTFIQMNGTKWDLNNMWLSDDNECTWFGMQCNARYQINNLAADNNNIMGSIPTELVHFESLQTLSMTRNHLSGTIPTEIITLPHLENILLYTNTLIGSIPSEIGLATNLKVLRLENNLLFGKITTEIGKLTLLEEFSIGFNEFWRHIPTEFGLLTNLKWLVMEENRLSGSLPTEFGLLTKLEYFLISKNLMIGPVPTEMAALTDLNEFRLANTGMGGSFPVEMAALTKLHRLEMGGNNFEGTIMTEFGNMTGLSWLSLNDNDFTGTIPTELGKLVNMTRLVLKDTFVTGTIPTELGMLTILQDLSLEGNLLNGTAPEAVCKLRSMELQLFNTDCPSPNGQHGVQCEVDTCCTFCRRSDHSG